MNSPAHKPTTKTLKEKYASLPKRVFTSSIVLSILFAAIYLDLKVLSHPIALNCLLVVIGSLVTHEFFEMSKNCQQKPFRIWGILITALLLSTELIRLFLATYLSYHILSLEISVLLISVGVFGNFLLQMKFEQTSEIFSRVATTTLGFIYIGFLASFLNKILWTNWILSMNSIGINHDKTGIYLLGITVLTVKSTDIGAFFIGAAIGKKKWIPHISPGKSIEGLVGGVCFATFIAYLLGNQLWPIFPNFLSTLCFGVCISYCGQLADLVESMFKRAANMKDSGNLLPGFGGFFDLTDSLIATAPIAYLLWFLILS